MLQRAREAGANALSRSLRREDLFAAIAIDAELEEVIDRMVPLGRQGTAEEVAAAVAFLASDDASLVTGHALAADGGPTVL